MNQDPSWAQIVQNTDGTLDDFLNDDNVGDFNDIDFSEFDLSHDDEGRLAFEGDARMLDRRPFVQQAGHPGAGPWSGAPGHNPTAAFATSAPAAMNFQPQPYQHIHQQHPHHAQYGGIPHPAVPPTPNSLEMHGKQPEYGNVDPNQARAVYESYARKQQQDQMVFTPLVSPAVTPLDNQFQIPEYAVPGEYFTPLTSPAMLAQSSHQRSVYGSVRGSDTSDAASPSDMEVDTTSPTAAHAMPAVAKGKKPAKGKPPPRTVRQSPAMKAQRKKAPTSNTIATKDVAEIMEEIEDGGSATSSRPGSSKLPLPRQKTAESSSISPEPLSEILMPPPATPRSGSKGRSPHLAPQDGSLANGPAKSPATPATLMRLQQNASGSTDASMQTVPRPKHTPPTLRPNLPNLPRNTESVSTPMLAASDNRGNKSAPPMPPSPSATAGTGTPRSVPKSKKPNNSTQPSPALRPKISPNIKPLLPEGASLSAETSALLLASKSNYQNLLEGNHLPGVIYPNALSVNLTSKRTSHKLAEQGRRNRMNTALLELAVLLPPTSPTTGAIDSPATTTVGAPAVVGAPMPATDSTANKSTTTGGNSSAPGSAGPTGKDGASSKASTVELAIDFIQKLQGELSAVKGRLAAAEEQLGRKVRAPSKSDAEANAAMDASAISDEVNCNTPRG